jgi:hypothetical protein
VLDGNPRETAGQFGCERRARSHLDALQRKPDREQPEYAT